MNSGTLLSFIFYCDDGAGQPENQNVKFYSQVHCNSIMMHLREIKTYGTHCNFPHHYCHRNRLGLNRRWPSIGICHCHISADNRRSNVIVHLHTAVGIDSVPLLNCTNVPVRHCHPCNSHVNCRIHIRANIHRYRNGMYRLDNCKVEK